jgi:hypothetical protein
MPDQRITVGTAADRQLEVLASGPADGVPLVFHTGTPGGLVPCRWVSEAAAAHGLRTVAGASIHLLPGEGHLTLVTTLIGQVLAELVSLAGLPLAGGW